MTDIAGNSTTVDVATFTGDGTTAVGLADIDVDLVAPVLSAAISSPDAVTHWYNIASGPATVSYTATDAGGSGVTAPAAYVFSDGADQSLAAVTVFDVAGNESNAAGAFDGIDQDTVAPVLSAVISGPGGTGWYNIASGPATVSYTATDAGGSGVTAPTAYVFGDGADQSLAAVTVFDVAGNESNAAGAFDGINQDTVAPVLSAVISGPGGTGWYNIASGPATVSYTATDAGGSGVSAPAAYVFSDGAGQSLAAVTVFDVAGNESNAAGAFDGINQDTVAPVLSAVISSPDAVTHWYNIASGAATVTYTATDAGGSGVSAPAAYVFGDGAGQSLAAVTVFDVAGNESNAAGGYMGINQDTVAPVLSAVISSPDGTGWYNIASGPATVSYTATDAGGSGVTAPTAYVFGDGADQSLAAVTVFDVAGNESNAAGGYTGIDQDTVAPVLSAVISSPDAVTGWYNIQSGAATVTYTATDAGGSGVSAPAAYVFSDGADQSLAALTVFDVAGNESNAAGAFDGINQDTVAPVLSAVISSPDAVTHWYNIASGPATVSYTATDAGGSGVTAPAAYVFGDGAGQSLAAVMVFDVAGNESNAAGGYMGINQDTVAPVLSAVISSPGGTGWYNIASGAATVTYTATDAGGSGVTAPAAYVFSDGADQSLAAVTVFDVAGNESNAAGAFDGINQDTVAPVLSAVISGPGGTGWYNIASGPATVSYTATDAGGSGVTAPAAYVFGDGADQSLAAVTVFDVAGNESNAAEAFDGIDQDTVAPVLSAVISSPDAVTGWYNIQSGPATVTYTASDAGGSGVTAPAAYVFGDGAGQSLAAVTVFDVAGNESNAAGGYMGINQDTVAPVLSAVISSPDGTGWYNIASGPATVSYTATDAGGSGVTAPTAYVFGDGADQSLAAVTVFDVAGNESNAAGGYTGIDQDTVAPVLSAVISSPDAVTGWYNIQSGAATVTYTATDAGGSGVTRPGGLRLQRRGRSVAGGGDGLRRGGQRVQRGGGF